MKQNAEPKGDFEQRLLDELKAVVAERDAVAADSTSAGRKGRRWTRLALAGACALAAAAIVLIFNSGGDNTSRAFAVEPQGGGGVRIRVYSLKDATGLERALEDAGIRAQVSWLAPGMSCREPHFTPSGVKLPGGGSMRGLEMNGPGTMTISVGSTQRWRGRLREHRRGEVSDEAISNINLDPRTFRSDQSVILSGSAKPYNGNSQGGFEARFAVAEGPVEPCTPVPAPAGSIASIKVPGGTGTGTPTEAPPAPGQFLYAKTKVVQLQGWEPGKTGAGSETNPRHFAPNLLGPGSKALPALVPTIREAWTAPDGKVRIRETLGRIDFLSAEDQRRWEEAGSPPPFSFDPGEHDVGRDHPGRRVKEFASRRWSRHPFSNVAKLSRLPTDPKALRLAIEGSGGGGAPAGSHVGAVTAERLLDILGEPITSRPLRRAAFDALAEIPGIGFQRGAVDVAGRRGDAITWVRERGFGRELIFDPRTSSVLAQAEVIFNARAAGYRGVPDGTPLREIANLQAGIADSTHERPWRRARPHNADETLR
jgi:hypothetical protein